MFLLVLYLIGAVGTACYFGKTFPVRTYTQSVDFFEVAFASCFWFITLPIMLGFRSRK